MAELTEPVSGGSQQLRMYRIARRNGVPMEQAIIPSGMAPDEGRYWDKRDAENPPPEEAFILIYDPDARAAASTNPTQEKENTMTKAKLKEDGEGAGIEGEYKRPDGKLAVEIYKAEIAAKKEHIATIKGDLSEPYKRIKDNANFPKKILELCIQLDEMEDAKRDHWLLALNSGLDALKITMPADLVTMANGEDAGSVIPSGARAKPRLVGVDDDFEMSEEELAAQKPRAKAKEKAELETTITN